ncbi:larval/pupal cuticle protein H1C-like [Condylostylus longicornis]|uniref:larval/pupal cuticle protein H1C-like n=1 Tax=Condylostylus longicornis TaxID=2530218 RepID=UPI00244E46DF|nr:larval/pupal cuticle protein H1C-like [Condylostylus longicornis]
MFKFIVIAAISLTIVNAGNIGLVGTAYSDASAVSSVYNSIGHHNNIEHHNQHETYIAKQPVAVALPVHSAPALQVHSVPALQLHSAPKLQVHSAPTLQVHSAPAVQVHSAPALKIQHSIPTPVQVHSTIHSAPALSVHSVAAQPTLKLQHSAVPSVQVHSHVPVLNLHSAPLLKLQAPPATAFVQHSIPSVAVHSTAPSSSSSIIKVQNTVPAVKLHSAQHLNTGTYSYDAAHNPSAAAVVYSNNKLPVAYATKEISYSLAPEVSHVSFEGHGTQYAW